MARVGTRQYFKRAHQKFILVDNDVFIGSSNIGKEYCEDEFGTEETFLDINARLKHIVSDKAQQIIERHILKYKHPTQLYSKASIKKHEMLKKLIEFPHRKDYIVSENNVYDLLISICGKKIEIQEYIFDNVNKIKNRLKLPKRK